MVLVFALSIAFAVSSALLMTERETWRDKHAQLEREKKQAEEAQTAKSAKLEHDLQEAKASLSKINDDLQRVTQEKSDLDKEKARLQAETTDKEKRLNELTTSLTAIRTGIGEWSARNEKLQKELADAQAKLKETDEALRQAKADCEKAKLERDEMTKKVADLEGQKKDFEDQLTRAKEALDRLAKAGAISLEEVLTGVQKPIDGRVLEVDPANNVVVISVGKQQGVGLGYSFTVYRDGEYVSEIRVDQLKDDLAGATPVPGTIKSEIRKGDYVTTRIR